MKSASKKKSRTEPSRAERSVAVFADTEVPSNANEVTEKYVAGFRRHETAETYRERAVAILRGNGYDVDADTDTQWFTRLTDNPNLNMDVYEAMELVLWYERLQSQMKFLLQIVRETKEAGAPVAGYESIPDMMNCVGSMALEIGGLGERLKARHAELSVVSQNQRRARALNWAKSGVEARRSIAKRKKAAIGILTKRVMDRYPQKTNSSDIARKVFDLMVAEYSNVKAGKFDSIRRKVAILRKHILASRP